MVAIHAVNLWGNDADECIPEARTYFGPIQTIYTIQLQFQEVEILAKRIGSHGFMGYLPPDGEIE